MKLRAFLLSIACPSLALAADEVADGTKGPKLPTPEASLKSLSVAPGLKAEIWASEPLLQNVVAFSFDDAGRCYVVETGRRRSSTLDIRSFVPWTAGTLKLRTVEQRIAFMKNELSSAKKLPFPKGRTDMDGDGIFTWKDLSVESEAVRVVEDSDGDGKADKSRYLAQGFNALETGTAAGVLPLPGGDVLFTSVPSLWLIKSDGSKKALSSGYGVHIAYGGHDMHGLRMGPDGRVYFTIADCGASVEGADGKRIENPDSGAVFRCWPDGTGLELYARGLRNPQHLAFNDLGDLFTGDNNADGGDKARIEHIVEGADYGWRIGWQFLPKLGAWNSEEMWALDASRKNLGVMPPVAFVGHGPAGFSYYPGTGLPEKFKGHFFMADFPGGVRHFALKQNGATYTVDGFAGDAPVLQDNKPGELTGKVVWNLYPSDVQFAPGGGVMVLDWVQGWEKTGKGRVFRLFSPELEKDPLIAETKKLLGEGMAKRPAADLGKLLGHADQRVRLAAQFELVKRKDASTLLAAAGGGNPLTHRLHGVWGAARLGVGTKLIGLVSDSEPEYTAQVIRSLADAGDAAALELARKHVGDKNARLQFQSLMALAKLGAATDFSLVSKALAANPPSDSYIRYAFAKALARHGDMLAKVDGKDPSGVESVNSTTLLALRIAKRKEIGNFLSSNAGGYAQALEAARAIHDDGIAEALPALAALADDAEFVAAKDLPKEAGKAVSAHEALARRVMNANHRLGTVECGNRLAHVAAGGTADSFITIFAAEALARWDSDNGIDPITGLARDLPAGRATTPFDAKGLADLEKGLKTAGPRTRALLATAIGNCGVKALAPQALALVKDAAQPGEVRAAALESLSKLEVPEAKAALEAALDARDAALVKAARKLQLGSDPLKALAAAKTSLSADSIAARQQAILALGVIADKQADELLRGLLQQMLDNKAPAALHLDILEAAGQRSDSKLDGLVKKWEGRRSAKDPVAAWRECLEGGDVKEGREIFAERAEAACMRCHAVAKLGGDVGPDLAGIAAKQSLEYLLQAIVDPNGHIAPGYENVLIMLSDGNVVAGLAVSEDATTVTVKNVADGKTQQVPKSSIKERQKLPSAMPPGLGDALGKRSLRDLMAYLATLK